MELESYHFSGELFSKAISLSKRFGMSLYDSSYIALAEELGCDFITADAKLLAKAKPLSFVKPL